MTEGQEECNGPSTATEIRQPKPMKESVSSHNNNNNVKYVPQIKWPDLLVQIFIHTAAVYGFYLAFTSARIFTILYTFFMVVFTGIGITAGVHRLWSHRSYKAKWPLRLLLMFMFTITGQRHAHVWASDHRIHHLYTDTDADPHNINRGFLFAHIGWIVLTPHPAVTAKRETIDMSDLDRDIVVVWQRKLYPLLFLLCVLLIPTYIPIYCWNESIYNSFWINLCRFCITLNLAYSVNSVGHSMGTRPYDKTMSPVENIGLAFGTMGEGWHNYHHAFPYDYKTGELGDRVNPSTRFINWFRSIGWAYDLRTASNTVILQRCKNKGDGTHPSANGEEHTAHPPLWGFDHEVCRSIEEVEGAHNEDKKEY